MTAIPFIDKTLSSTSIWITMSLSDDNGL